MATGGDLTVQNIGPVAPVKNHCHVNAKPDTFPAEENGETVNPTTPTVDPGEERRRFAEFGLGRGVDITDPSPFMNKKSFQFYTIDSEDMIIRTDEGKARRCIFQKFETSNASSIQLSASVTLPHTPIEIGAAVDYSRNIMQRGYTIGWKTIIRSIEFRKGHPGKEPENSFEKWVNERLPTTLYDKENDDDLIVYLIELIIEFGITHYVSKIVLGSAEYRAMSERHYSTFAKGKMHLGVEKIVDTLLTASKKQMSSFEVTEIKWIGQVDEHGKVTRQGVVDAKLESIANLISPDYKEGRLRNALSKALGIYVTIRTSYIPARLAKEDKVVKRAIEEFRRLEPFGYEQTPKYAICCRRGAGTFYLDIDSSNSNQVIAKKREKHLHFFNLRFTETPGEFIIMDDEGDTQLQVTLEDNKVRHYDIQPTHRYLKVNTYGLGRSFGKLCMESSVDEYHCRLKLRPRLFHKHGHASMREFTNGEDIFYICTSRRRGRTGYLYLAQTAQPNAAQTTQPNAAQTTQPNAAQTTQPNGAQTTQPNGAQTTQPNGAQTTQPNGAQTTQPNGAQTTQPAADPCYVLACKSSIRRGNSDDLMLFRLVRDDDIYDPKQCSDPPTDPPTTTDPPNDPPTSTCILEAGRRRGHQIMHTTV